MMTIKRFSPKFIVQNLQTTFFYKDFYNSVVYNLLTYTNNVFYLSKFLNFFGMKRTVSYDGADEHKYCS